MSNIDPVPMCRDLSGPKNTSLYAPEFIAMVVVATYASLRRSKNGISVDKALS